MDALESFPPNVAMLQRLKDGLASPEDINFYQHEMIEAELMAEGLDARAAHLRTLERQGVAYEPGYEAQLYHWSVISDYPDHFNPAALAARRR